MAGAVAGHRVRRADERHAFLGGTARLTAVSDGSPPLGFRWQSAVNSNLGQRGRVLARPPRPRRSGALLGGGGEFFRGRHQRSGPPLGPQPASGAARWARFPRVRATPGSHRVIAIARLVRMGSPFAPTEPRWPGAIPGRAKLGVPRNATGRWPWPPAASSARTSPRRHGAGLGRIRRTTTASNAAARADQRGADFRGVFWALALRGDGTVAQWAPTLAVPCSAPPAGLSNVVRTSAGRAMPWPCSGTGGSWAGR